MADLRGNRMAMIFQEPMTSLNPAYTIGNQLTEVLRAPPARSDAPRRATAPCCSWKRSASRPPPNGSRQYPHQLSGGLRQRVMIAMALMCGPKLIIADEPTTALDVTIQAQILRLLASIQRELDMAVILITHDLGIVARVGDPRRGDVCRRDRRDRDRARGVFASPRTPIRRACCDCIPVPGKTPRGGRLGSIPGMVPSLIGDHPGLRLSQPLRLCGRGLRQAAGRATEISTGRA